MTTTDYHFFSVNLSSEDSNFGSSWELSDDPMVDEYYNWIPSVFERYFPVTVHRVDNFVHFLVPSNHDITVSKLCLLHILARVPIENVERGRTDVWLQMRNLREDLPEASFGFILTAAHWLSQSYAGYGKSYKDSCHLPMDSSLGAKLDWKVWENGFSSDYSNDIVDGGGYDIFTLTCRDRPKDPIYVAESPGVSVWGSPIDEFHVSTEELRRCAVL